jgi:hypothetical protein
MIDGTAAIRSTSETSGLEARRCVLADAGGRGERERGRDHERHHRLLEHHADAVARGGDAVARRVDVLAVEQHLAARLRGAHQLVHAVEDAQERRPGAARRDDERRAVLAGTVSDTRSSTLLEPNQAETLRASSVPRRCTGVMSQVMTPGC